jgi:CubicO group peptidase (beta-lactamase class C family)
VLAWVILCLGMVGRAEAQNIHSDPAISLRTSFALAQGWDQEKLSQARQFAQKIGSTAVVVMHKGKLVAEWGDTALPSNTHSLRKSLLSALYGVAVQKKLIKLSSTLEDLGIDDNPPSLTRTEKQATVLDLLKARSGVYHPAAYESAKMKRLRPKRGSHPPGTFWYYNNWDFNVLGTIFEKQTNLSIGKAFAKWIAGPIGMQDFKAENVKYVWDDCSQHPAYPTWISARDVARFGLLFLGMGRWNQKQIIPKQWVIDSTTSYSQTKNWSDGKGGYGYMWWIRPGMGYYGSGAAGQKVLVLPKQELVVVNRVNTGPPSFLKLSRQEKRRLTRNLNPVSLGEFVQLARLVIQAEPTSNSSPLTKGISTK